MPEPQTTIDPDTAQLMRDLEEGLKEAQTGVYAQVHTPNDIARRNSAPETLTFAQVARSSAK